MGDAKTSIDLEGMRASHAASQSRLDHWKRLFPDASTDKRQANALAVQTRQCFNGTDGVAAHIDRGLLIAEVAALRADCKALAAECEAWRDGRIQQAYRDVRHPDGDEDDRMTVLHIVDHHKIVAATDASGALAHHAKGGGA